jgi:DNA-binding NtrC family response regulator
MLKCDARIICATNCSLRERVVQEKFREDLFHRLNGLTLLIPPLRERLEELPALIAAELKAAAKSEGKTITAIHPQAMERLTSHPWPGNLRELSHTVRTMTLFCDGPVILPQHVVFPPDLAAAPNHKDGAQPVVNLAKTNNEHGRNDLSLASAVARHVSLVYEQTSRNQRQAARLLGISRATLARHLRKLDQK